MSETRVGDRVRITKSYLVHPKLSGQHGIVTVMHRAGPMDRQMVTVLLDSDGLEHDVEAAFVFSELARP